MKIYQDSYDRGFAHGLLGSAEDAEEDQDTGYYVGFDDGLREAAMRCPVHFKEMQNHEYQS